MKWDTQTKLGVAPFSNGMNGYVFIVKAGRCGFTICGAETNILINTVPRFPVGRVVPLQAIWFITMKGKMQDMDEREKKRSLQMRKAAVYQELCEIQRLVDGLMIAVGLQFGNDGAEGEKTLHLDAFNMENLLQAYGLEAKRSNRGGYSITVKRRKKP